MLPIWQRCEVAENKQGCHFGMNPKTCGRGKTRMDGLIRRADIPVLSCLSEQMIFLFVTTSPLCRNNQADGMPSAETARPAQCFVQKRSRQRGFVIGSSFPTNLTKSELSPFCVIQTMAPPCLNRPVPLPSFVVAPHKQILPGGSIQFVAEVRMRSHSFRMPHQLFQMRSFRDGLAGVRPGERGRSGLRGL